MKNIKTISFIDQLVKTVPLAFFLIFLAFSTSLKAQETRDIRWKTEAQVRALYGQPNSIQGPIGTHASYSLWKYENFTVSFANNRAFHLFRRDSLTRTIELQEQRR